MKVNMLSTTDNGQMRVGTFELKDGKIVIDAGPDAPGDDVGDSQRYMRNIYKRPLGNDGVTPDQNPERWLRLLPQAYTGAYLRAELIGAKPITEDDYIGPPPRNKITIAKKKE